MIVAHNVRYVRQGNTILDGITWKAERNEHWIMLGPNGSGKSSFIKLLTLYEWPTDGFIEIDGMRSGTEPVSVMRQKIGLFEPALHSSIAHFYPDMTGEEIVQAGARGALALYDPPAEEVVDRARKLLVEERLPYERSFSVMSSGEQRRTLLMRALMSKPSMLILDEPFESLDMKARYQLESTLKRNTEGMVTLTALHRIEEIPAHASHALLMKNGKVLRSGPLEELLNRENLSELYEMQLEVTKHAGRYSCRPT
jgi:iron complex transport system ATP-binding protein